MASLNYTFHQGSLTDIGGELPKGISWCTHPHQAPTNLIPGVNSCVLDPNSGKTIGLSTWFYWEIELESGAITFHDLRESFEENELHCSGPIALQGNHVFFLSDALLFRGAPWKVAALNRKTLEVDWLYEFPPGTRIHARGPQVQGKHLFVVDSKNTLYLFERE